MMQKNRALLKADETIESERKRDKSNSDLPSLTSHSLTFIDRPLFIEHVISFQTFWTKRETNRKSHKKLGLDNEVDGGVALDSGGQWQLPQ